MSHLFFGNCALQAGGIGCHDCLLFVSSVSFINNTALILHGGAIFTHRAGGVFANTTVVGNSETAFVFFQSRAIFIGRNTFKENRNAISAGGAMHLIISTVTFSGYTLFESNYAFQLGGGIAALVKSKFLFSAITKFIRG